MQAFLAILYVSAGIALSSAFVEIDRQRCRDTAPGHYVVIAAIWPLYSGALTYVQLRGWTPSNFCEAAR